MITQWSVARFKSIRDSLTLDTAPLTVFAGPNSSGKSTILQSILLMAQTLSSKVEHRQLVFNGDLVRLGTLEDIKSAGSGDAELKLGFKIQSTGFDFGAATTYQMLAPWLVRHSRDELRTVEAILSFGVAETESSAGPEAKQATLVSAEFKYTASSPENTTAQKKRRNELASGGFCVRRRTSTESAAMDQLVPNGAVDDDSLLYAVSENGGEVDLAQLPFMPTPHGIRLPMNVVSASMQHFLPRGLFAKFSLLDDAIHREMYSLTGMSDRERRQTIAAWKSDSNPVRRAFALHEEQHPGELQLPKQRSLIDDDQPERKVTARLRDYLKDSELAGKSGLNFLPPTELMGIVGATISSEFLRVRYLGPLRDEPKPLYEIARSSDPRDVGIRGENTAAVLDLHQSSHVDFVPPNGGHRRKETLASAVKAWAQHLGIAHDFTTNDAGKLGHRLHVRPDDIEMDVDLTNVGVGVSQVLPILVMALISEPGAVLLFEQPELHLHPRVQSLLADFFLAVISTGRQCIVETHSEYLINRLRLRVAESSTESTLSSRIAIYFVEREHGQSRYKLIQINPFGAIPDWPSGFFDQGPAESERIFEAAQRKRALQRSKTTER